MQQPVPILRDSQGGKDHSETSHFSNLFPQVCPDPRKKIVKLPEIHSASPLKQSLGRGTVINQGSWPF